MEDYALAFFILILLVGVVGLIGNFVVVIVYLYDKSLRSFTKYFFVNLSIVDMLIILICLPVGLLDLANEGIWILGQRICETHSFIENTLVCVSSLTLISISLERYIAISRPFKITRWLNKNMCIMIIISLWIISIVISTPSIRFAIYYKEVTNITYNGTPVTQATVEMCFYDRSSLLPKIYVSTFTGLVLFTPTLILTGVYIVIIRKLKKLNECYFDHQKNKHASKASSSLLTGGDETMTHNKIVDRKSSILDKIRFINYKGANGGKNRNRSASFLMRANNELRSDPEYYTNNSSSHSYSMRLATQSKKLIENSEKKRMQSSKSFQQSLTSKKSLDKTTTANTLAANSNNNKPLRFSYGKSLIAKRNQTITICLISLAFFFCQIPIKVFQMFNTFYVFENLNHETDLLRFKVINIIFLCTKLLFFLHGMSNPIIYNLMSTKFRNSFKNAILCKPLNKPNSYVHKFFFNNNHQHNIQQQQQQAQYPPNICSAEKNNLPLRPKRYLKNNNCYD